MSQESVWDREYKNSKLLTKENKPQSDVVRFAKFLQKNGFNFNKSILLDLGSGTGRNSFYFAGHGAKVIGYEISKEANKVALELSKNLPDDILRYIAREERSMGEKFPLENDSVDIILDVTSSNSLTEAERKIYLIESHRVLKPEGYFFVKALCKDGDLNASELLKKFPGTEKDTYVMPEMGIVERVWSKADFVEAYEKYFTIISLDKKTSYSRMNNRSYKRNFWIAILKKFS